MRTSSRSRVVAGCAALAGLVPAPAAAHVKWLVRAGVSSAARPDHFSIAEPSVKLWIALVLAGLAAVLLLDDCLPGPPNALAAAARQHRRRVIGAFRAIVGVALLAAAAYGVVLAPNLAVPDAIGGGLRTAEAVVGLLLITNNAPRLAAASMIALYAICAVHAGWCASLENLDFLGIALFLILEAPAAGGVDPRWRSYAAPLLRIHAGIAIGVLAWTEKLVDPTLAMTLLEKHHLNFASALGAAAMSDRLFTLCAGCTELTIALLLVTGAATRINTLAFAAFLAASNLYFVATGHSSEALIELSGHLRLFATAMMLVVDGAGDRLRVRVSTRRLLERVPMRPAWIDWRAAIAKRRVQPSSRVALVP